MKYIEKFKLYFHMISFSTLYTVIECRYSIMLNHCALLICGFHHLVTITTSNENDN